MGILSAVRARADGWLAHPAHVPSLAGGWVHDYVCPVHWTALAFDPDSPHVHRCLSGETYTSPKLAAAWRALEHRRIAAAARDLALVCAVTGEPAYAAAAVAILSQYADHYGRYAGADTARAWMLRGRVFNQALTEALWTVPIVHAYDLVREILSPAQNAHIVYNLLRPIAATLATAQEQELRHGQGDPGSNYNAWLIAALGLLGFALDDRLLLDRALDNTSGFRAHLAAAILQDGFEREGTPYYHNFVAWAYTVLAEAARANQIDLYAERGPQGQSIYSVWRALASLADRDGTIPPLNDGAYYLGGPFAAEICETYEVALARTREPEYAWLLDRQYAGRPRDAWTALVYGDQEIAGALLPPRASVCLRSIGIAVLRDETRAQEICVPFGAYAGSHSHFDRLGIAISPWSTAPGTPLYGIPARDTWYRQTAAHNTVLVNGKSQAPCAGELLRWNATPESTELALAADSAYPGVRYSRMLKLTRGLLQDSFAVESKDEHTFDWLLHCDGDLRTDPMPRPGEGALGDGMYQFLTPTAQMDDLTRFEFVVHHGGRHFQLTLVADIPFTLILASSPASVVTPTQPRTTLIARVRGRRAHFVATSECMP